MVEVGAGGDDENRAGGGDGERGGGVGEASVLDEMACALCDGLGIGLKKLVMPPCFDISNSHHIFLNLLFRGWWIVSTRPFLGISTRSIKNGPPRPRQAALDDLIE